MELLLGKKELLDLGMCMHRARISCHEGRCWITQEGDSRDHIMNTGGSLIVSATGRLIITAMEPCRIMLHHSVTQAQRERKGFRRWFREFQLVSLQTD